MVESHNPFLGEITSGSLLQKLQDIWDEIQKICGEIAGTLSMQDQCPEVDESDLSSKRLNEYKSRLQELQREKCDRLQKVHDFVDTVHDLCTVLGMDFFSTLLALASQLIDLWNLMDTPEEERRLFDHVTCNMSASADDMTASGALALDLIELPRKALSRREILNRVEKWMCACEEESWLEDYNWDDKRYNTTMLDEYALLRQEMEEERRWFRDQKKHQDRQSTEQEPIFRTKSSPAKPSSGKKVENSSPQRNGGSNGTSHGKRLPLNSSGDGNKPAVRDGRRDSMKSSATSKDDASPNVSSNEPVLASP
ncbi:hypothetical protein MLD38_022087 [Melastoma candidum]|uniref:Uncharacterized protein n=1 Tax=Melastoma candidum TaxID=119954 RepID=A0ACB9QR88_9MYRT|nr:hypothetical protein MLD38_022087 [Melastoma candidum]